MKWRPLVLALFLSSVFAQANTEFVVQSIHNGKTPFLVVIEDADGASKRAPGIYSATKEGSWQIVFEGKVLRGRASQGIARQLETTKRTQSYESVAVSDGIINIFDINSNSNDSASILKVGSNISVVDFQTKQLVTLPLVNDLDDVQVESFDSGDGEVVLVSMRLPGYALMGNGITFALFLEQKPIKEQKPNAYILDYKFRDSISLRKLAGTGSLVISTNVIRALQSRQDTHFRILSDWKAKLRKYLDLADSVAGITKFYNDLPLVDLRTGKAVIQQPPVIEFNFGHVYARQYYDPINGRDKVKIHYLDMGFEILGRMDADSNGEARGFSGVSDGMDALIFVENEIYFAGLAGPNHEVSGVKINFPSKKIIDYAWVRGDHAGDKSTKYVLLSVRFEDDTTQTELIKIHKSDKGFGFTERIHISNEFYSHEALTLRLSTGEDETGTLRGEQLFFDNVTKNTTTAEYHQIRKPTSLLISLNNSRPNALAEGFAEAVKDIPLTDGIWYQEYDDWHASRRYTGISIKDYYDKIVGQLLGKVTQEGNINRLYFTDYKISHPGRTLRETNVHLQVYATDSSHNGGKDSYTLNVIVTGDKSDSTKNFKPAVLSFSIQKSFESLKSVSVVKGQGNNNGEITLFIASETEGGGDVLQKQFRMNLTDNSSGIRFVEKPLLTLVKEFLSPSEISQRVQITKDGRMYWVLTPNKGREDPEYQVCEFGNDVQKFNPNRMGLQIKSYAELKPSETKEDMGYSYFPESWNIFGPFSLLSQLKDIYANADEKLITSVSESIRERVDKIKGQFPNFGKEFDRILLDGTFQNHVFILPDETAKVRFLTLFAGYIDREASLLRADNSKPLYFAGPEKIKTLDMVTKNLNEMVTSRKPSTLVLDAKVILADPVPVREVTEEGTEVEPNRTHLLYLAATGGHQFNSEVKEPPDLRKSAVRTFTFATAQEWSQLSLQLQEAGQDSILSRFNENLAFFETPWTLHAPMSGKATKEIQDFADLGITDLESQIVPSLLPLLRDMSNRQKPAKHQVLIVPDEMKKLVRRIAFSQWASRSGAQSGETWSYANEDMRAHVLSLHNSHGNFNQGQVITYLDTLRKMSSVRPFLYVDMADIAKNGRVAGAKEQEFVIRDFAKAQTPNQDITTAHESGTSDESEEKTKIPHALYLLATEGAKIQPKEFESHKVDPNISTLIIGTRSEWEAIRREVGFEQRFGLLDRFETSELEPPSIETRRSFVLKTLDSSEIRSLNYKFELRRGSEVQAGLTQQEARERVAGILVNRAESLARQTNQEVTTAFLNVLTEFTRSLTEDPSLRTRRIVDNLFIEKLLSKTFNISLNIQVLPPDDPLVRLKDENRAALALQEAGYEGPLELKINLIRTIMAQTRSDTVRTIPSTVIAYGDTSTGKTFLFKSLIKMLGLQTYDFNNPGNKEAQAFVINFSKMRETATDESEGLTSEMVIKHLQNFLALPNGYRGFILLDDAHKASPKDLKEILSFIQGMFEATNGRIRVQDFTKRSREIPVKNLMMMMTLNPTSDSEKIKRFAPHHTDVEMVVATLTSAEYPIDASFIARWTTVLNLSKFPVEAKAPKLMELLRGASRNEFGVNSRIVMVAPSAVSQLVGQFPDANAREFLAQATNRFLEISGSDAQSSAYLVVPKHKLFQWGWWFGDSAKTAPTGRQENGISEFIDANTTPVPLEDSVDGVLHLMRFNLDVFRNTVYESFINNVNQDPRYASPAQAQLLLAPVLHGIVSTIVRHPNLPMSSLRLDPFDFGIRNAPSREDFQKVLRYHTANDKEIFPNVMKDVGYDDGLLDELQDYTKVQVRERTRLHVIQETSQKARAIVQKFLAAMLRTPDLARLPTPESWVESLNDSEPVQAYKAMGIELANLYLEFLQEMQSRTLVENARPLEFPEVKGFEYAKLFTISVDQAIAILPWGRISSFLAKGMVAAARDMDKGQTPGVQHYMFTSRLSLLKPSTIDVLVQLAASTEAYRKWTPEMVKKFEDGFDWRCDKILSGGKK